MHFSLAAWNALQMTFYDPLWVHSIFFFYVPRIYSPFVRAMNAAVDRERTSGQHIVSFDSVLCTCSSEWWRLQRYIDHTMWMSCTTGFKSNWKFYSILLHKHKNVWIVNEYSNDTQTHKTSFNLCLLFWSFILANDESQSKFVVFLRNSLDFFHVFVLEIPLQLH